VPKTVVSATANRLTALSFQHSTPVRAAERQASARVIGQPIRRGRFNEKPEWDRRS